MTNRFPYTEGDRGTADIVFIGEAPGEDEELSGLPFQGRAGELLDRLLTTVGINRSDCYITNVIKERPRNNNIKPFLDLSAKSGPVESEKYLYYKRILIEELNECKSAKVIVPLGNVPLYALLGLQQVTKRRGSVYEWQGRKVIPTIHPAGALRMYIYKHFIQMDLIRIMEISENPKFELPERNLILDPTYKQVISSLLHMKNNCKLIATDIETVSTQNSFEVSHISFAWTPLDAICIPFIQANPNPLVNASESRWTDEEELSIWQLIAEILQDKNITKVLQEAYGIFDFSFLYRKYGIRIHNLEDTMAGQSISAPDFPKGLDFICSIHTFEPYYKDEGKRDMHKYVKNEPTFRRYSALDSAVLLEALPNIKRDLLTQSNLHTYHQTCKLFEPLVYMQERGIAVNHDNLNKLKKEAEEEIATLKEELTEIMGDINLNSPKQLMEYFYIKKGIPAFKKSVKRNTGKRETVETIDKKALKRLAMGTQSRKPMEEASKILRLRYVSKRYSTYYCVKLGDDGRFHMGFNPTRSSKGGDEEGGSRQGRLSSTKTIFGEGMNSQNQPIEMKQVFTADPNCMLWEFDLSQAENRIVAYIAPEPKMIKAFEDYDAGKGPDVHRITAGWIFDKDPYLISDEDGSASFGDGTKSERFWGKKSNHSFNYDEGGDEFAMQCEIGIGDGRKIYAKYHKAYYGIHRWHAAVQAQLGRTRTLTNLMGRSYTFLERWNRDLFKQAYSYVPQSTVGDIINQCALIPLYYNEKPEFEIFEPLNQVHDSIYVQNPITSDLSTIAHSVWTLKQSMEPTLEAHGRTFKIPTDAKVTLSTLSKARKIKLTSEVEILNQLREVVDAQVQ